jgi:hypothetical protein
MSKSMANLSTTEADYLTGKEITRPMTAAEIAQWELDRAAELEIKNAEALKVQAKAALLERLGLSADEAALLLS